MSCSLLSSGRCAGRKSGRESAAAGDDLTTRPVEHAEKPGRHVSAARPAASGPVGRSRHVHAADGRPSAGSRAPPITWRRRRPGEGGGRGGSRAARPRRSRRRHHQPLCSTGWPPASCARRDAMMLDCLCTGLRMGDPLYFQSFVRVHQRRTCTSGEEGVVGVESG